MDPEDEALLSGAHFIAGAIAGTAEHTGMYPIDTIKTHIQVNLKGAPQGIIPVARQIWSQGGIPAFFRGITAIIGGAAPAHAVYFTAYEYFKRLGHKVSGNTLSPLVYGSAGALATIIQDGIMTPMDTIKQRRQLAVKSYSSTWHCFRSIVKAEGYTALWAGYTTTLFMNVPFHAIYLNCYELFRSFLVDDPNTFRVSDHIIAGGAAGVVASALTTPLDVAKTKLQTCGDVGQHYRGMIHTLVHIWKTEGVPGLGRGIIARMIFHSLSAGTLWTTYEYAKFVLGARDPEEGDSMEVLSH